MPQSLKRFLFVIGGYFIFVVLFILAAKFFQTSGIFFSFDKAVLDFFISMRREWLTEIMKAFTFIGGIEFIFPASAALLVWFWLSKRIFHFLLLFFSVSVSAGLVFLLKDFFARLRPGIESQLVNENSLSFPSGHAMMAIAFWGVLAYFLAKRVRNRFWKNFSVAIIIVLAFSISISRVYLGVHWPTDILGSWILGGVWFAGLIWLSERRLKEAATNMPE